MEKLKEKHNHKLTDLLKVAMFSLVMLAPFLSIGVRCGYVMWNKNAKDSYSGSYGINYKYETNEVNNISDLKVGNVYTLNYDYDNIDSTYYVVTATMINAPRNNFMVNINDFNNGGYITIVINNQQIYFYLNDVNNQYITSYTVPYNDIDFVFYTTASGTNNFIQYISESTYNEIDSIDTSGTLDNAFSYSVSQISNDPIFNWTRNTGIYTPMNAMVEGLEIENDTLQILLAYWSLMTAVYIVFDLIIFCFTKITHFING